MKNLAPKGSLGLSYLDLTGCSRIKAGFLHSVSPSFHFSDVSESFHGFTNRSDESSLRFKAILFETHTNATKNIQRLARGRKSREGEVKTRKLEWAGIHLIPKSQAIVRGHIQRKLWKEKINKREKNIAATKLEAVWRGQVDRKIVSKIIEGKLDLAVRSKLATTIQCSYRGYKGRDIRKKLRVGLARKNLVTLKTQAKYLRAAMVLQRFFRGEQSRALVFKMMVAHEEANMAKLRKDKSALVIQRVTRGMRGRIATKQTRSNQELYEYNWYHARKIQTMWRGLKGQERWRVQRAVVEQVRRSRIALYIQRFWRGLKGREGVAMAKSAESLRRRECRSAIIIQKHYRGRFQGAFWVRKMKEDRKQQNGAGLIQRCFRGCKGRAFHSALEALKQKIGPLRMKLLVSRKELATVRESLSIVSQNLAEKEMHMEILGNELSVIHQTKAKYWDTDQITGTPQRFVTELVKVSFNVCVWRKSDILDSLLFLYMSSRPYSVKNPFN